MCCWFCPAPSILSVPNALFVQYCTIYWATYCLKVENFSKLVRLQSLLSKFTPIHIICVTSRFNVSKTMFLLRGPVLQPPPWWSPALRLFPFIKVCPALGTTAGDRDVMWCDGTYLSLAPPLTNLLKQFQPLSPVSPSQLPKQPWPEPECWGHWMCPEPNTIYFYGR